MTKIKNRIDQMFDRCKEENRAALILYVTGGFPKPAITGRILEILAENGCDLIEFGVPFSDPIADGPVIQKASTKALNHGMTFLKGIEILKVFGQKHDTPTILFGSINPFIRRGLKESAQLAVDAKCDGFLAADLPTEESDEFRAICTEKNLHLIPLLAPTTTNERIKLIGEKVSGFLYCMSVKGITGARTQIDSSVDGYLERVRSHTDLPIALGFGVSSPEQVRDIANKADGVVIGSKLISVIDEAVGDPENPNSDWESKIAEFVRSLADAAKRS